LLIDDILNRADQKRVLRLVYYIHYLSNHPFLLLESIQWSFLFFFFLSHLFIEIFFALLHFLFHHKIFFSQFLVLRLQQFDFLWQFYFLFGKLLIQVCKFIQLVLILKSGNIRYAIESAKMKGSITEKITDVEGKCEIRERRLW
jgi:hypothetical protein